ncbi:MAG TPA: ArsA-related P-loop ATPase [Acidimicrobiales bacterium]|nr:ArsA-related P-loop ATPase [Acidimicrobiales bacterium]
MTARAADFEPGAGIESLLSAKEIVIACGSGGVGKTTTVATAAAMAAVHLDGRVLALTVDPARRLANALGLQQVGNIETRVDKKAFAEAGVTARGELWVAMLDTKASWDELVRQHAPDRKTAEAILVNPLYRNITAKFVHSHDYIAMERLHDIHSSGRYDLIVVDTPPTRNAIDFLDAPSRMADFFSSRLLRWLIAPYRSRLLTAASRPFYSVADRVLGAQFLQDIADFFILFQTMYDGFVERAKAVTRTLQDDRTSFLVVTTLDPDPVREAEFFIAELRRRKYHLGAVVFNRVLPAYLRDRDARVAAERLRDEADELAATMKIAERDRAAFADVLREVADSFLGYRALATRQAEQLAEFGTASELTLLVPALEEGVSSISDIVELGQRLW